MAEIVDTGVTTRADLLAGRLRVAITTAPLARIVLVGMIGMALVTCTSDRDAERSAPSMSVRNRSSISPSGSADPDDEFRAIEVQVMGRTMSGHCRGTDTGAPTIILTPGNGGDQTTLSGLEGYLQDRAVVCAYDRAGIGGSESAHTRPRPVTDVVEEFRMFLDAADIPPPYFLFGESQGGAITFMFAQAYSEDVAGFVVDNPMPPPYTADIEAARRFLTRNQLQHRELPDFLGENPEGISFTDNDTMLSDPLPASMPYAVLFDENCDGDVRFCERVLQFLPQIERSLARVGEGGRFRWVKGAGHLIHLTRPRVVQHTIDEIWNEATGG